MDKKRAEELTKRLSAAPDNVVVEDTIKRLKHVRDDLLQRHKDYETLRTRPYAGRRSSTPLGCELIQMALADAGAAVQRYLELLPEETPHEIRATPSITKGMKAPEHPARKR
jgi:hypothetical protein